jgi:hypothetical protein
MEYNKGTTTLQNSIVVLSSTRTEPILKTGMLSNMHISLQYDTSVSLRQLYTRVGIKKI